MGQNRQTNVSDVSSRTRLSLSTGLTNVANDGSDRRSFHCFQCQPVNQLGTLLNACRQHLSSGASRCEKTMCNTQVTSGCAANIKQALMICANALRGLHRHIQLKASTILSPAKRQSQVIHPDNSTRERMSPCTSSCLSLAQSDATKP